MRTFLGRSGNLKSVSSNNFRSYFVKFQETPNDFCYKFYVPKVNFLPQSASTMFFDRSNDFQSPLAQSILASLPMVEEVTIGPSFVTVRKVDTDNSVAAAKYFAMKFQGSTEILDNPEMVAERSMLLQQHVMDTMKEEENEGQSAAASSSATAFTADGTHQRDTFEMGGFQMEQGNDDEIDEAAIRDLIEATNWSTLKLHVSALLTDHLHSGNPHVAPDAPHPHTDTLPQEGDSEVVHMIKELIATSIRPQLQDDGGDIRFCAFDPVTGVMEVEMLGACRTCKSSKTTLVDLIERTTRHWIPEVSQVKEVERATEFEKFSRLNGTFQQSTMENTAQEEPTDDTEHVPISVEVSSNDGEGFRVLREVNKPASTAN